MRSKAASLRAAAASLLLVFVAGAQGQADAANAAQGRRYEPPACSLRPTHALAALEQARKEQSEGAADASMLPSAEPVENFAIARQRLLAYGECEQGSACYWADLDAQYRRAEDALKIATAHHRRGEKLALVMDIDETSLTNYCEMRREDFGYIGSMFNTWVVSPEAAVAIPGGVRLFHRAKAAGVAVFFITGRAGKPDPASTTHGADQTEATARNLEAAGYHGWKGLQLRNGAENGMTTIAYKSTERQWIVDQGYRIVLSVGDQWSDLLGEPQAEVSVKLPNPFYFLP